MSSNLPGCDASACDNILTFILTPELRAFGGKSARNVLAVLPDRALNGEKTVDTEVM